MIVVAMPAYNEAEGIEEFILEIVSSFADEALQVHVLVQDDCSTDTTASVCGEISVNGMSPVTVESNVTNLGHGPTSRRALERALQLDAEWIIHVDGDGQYKGKDLASLLTLAIKSDSTVIGRRVSRTDPWFRQILTRTLRTYVAVFTRSTIDVDLNSPVRVHKKSQLDAILQVVPQKSLIPSVWCNFLTIRSHPYSSIPIKTYDRRGSTSIGTMWSTGKPRLIVKFFPSRRLLKFSLRAAREVLTLIRVTKSHSW
jgi:dolichol-phosphate mannosyltransferase